MCPQCTRELYLFKPLLEKIGQIEKEGAKRAQASLAQAERIAELENELAALRASATTVVAAVAVGSPGHSPAQASESYASSALRAVLPVLVLLIAAHGLLLFVYDVKPLYLRIASILIPIPFAFMLAARQPARNGASTLAGLGTALAAVFGMLVLTALVDKVPVLPHDLRELRETLEYVASIWLEFVTGLLLAGLSRRPAQERRPNPVVLVVARAFTSDTDGKLGIEKAIRRVETLVKAVTPAATAAASVYSGIKILLGDPG